MSVKETVKKGSTHHCWQFVREVRRRLEEMVRKPRWRRFLQGAEFYEMFEQYRAKTKSKDDDWKVVMFNYKAEPVKNQHCVIIVSDYYADFFASLQKMYQKDYKQISEMFLRDFVQIAPLQLVEWIDNFHVHFMPVREIPPGMDGWVKWVTDNHRSPLRITNGNFKYQLRELDSGIYPEIGWVDVNPHEFFVNQELSVTAK